MEWRRWLTPGTPVVLHFEDWGLQIIASDGSSSLRWSEVTALAVRGPDGAERRGLKYGGPGLVGLLLNLLDHAEYGSEFRRCWLAVGRPDGETIFGIDNLLRDDLERLLAEHSV